MATPPDLLIIKFAKMENNFEKMNKAAGEPDCQGCQYCRGGKFRGRFHIIWWLSSFLAGLILLLASFSAGLYFGRRAGADRVYYRSGSRGFMTQGFNQGGSRPVERGFGFFNASTTQLNEAAGQPPSK